MDYSEEEEEEGEETRPSTTTRPQKGPRLTSTTPLIPADDIVLMEVDNDNQIMEIDNNIHQQKAFLYQKENHLLKHLPYYHALEKETEDYLQKIILNLGKTVLTSDFQMGFGVYAKSLKNYITLYGRKFTKSQHIDLIHLFMSILTSDQTPLACIFDVSDVLNTLLRKPELLTRSDLTIQWRPLYETLDRSVFHRKYTLSYSHSAKLEQTLKETIRLSNVYFPAKETFPQVLEEFTQYLCPTSSKMVFGLEMLKHFIPFLDQESEQDINAFLKTLLHDYFHAWGNGPTWEWTLLSLLSTAAWNMPHQTTLDWTEYLPTIYARIVKNLELPVYFKGAKTNRDNPSNLKHFDFASVARWMVATLGNNEKSLNYLSGFLKSLETYYNPTNYGRWTMPLGALLNELVNSFSLRLKKERYLSKKYTSTNRWWYAPNPTTLLTDQDIQIFVKTTSRIVLDFHLDLNICGFVLKNLACIRPDIIIPAVMEKYEQIVETLTEPRKYMTTLRWVTIVMLPMLSSRMETENYDGRELAIPFALSLLPAIDPNDMYKTLSALGCLHGLVNLIPLVDCSHLAGESDEKTANLCTQTGLLQDFCLQFLERILNLIDSRTVENTRMSDNRTVSETNAEDVSLEKFIWAVFQRIAMQSSSLICKSLWKKVVSYALGSTLETGVSGKLFAGGVLQPFVVARPDLTLPKIIPQLCASINSQITPEILEEEDLDKTLLFQLLMLSYITETSGTHLSKFLPILEETFQKIFTLKSKKAYTFGSRALARCLQSLLYIYPMECKLTAGDYDSREYLAVEDWSLMIPSSSSHNLITTPSPNNNSNWHTPSSTSFTHAISLFKKIFTHHSQQLETCKNLTQSSPKFNKSLLKNLQIILSSYEGIATIAKFWDSTPIDSSVIGTTADLSPDPFDFGLNDLLSKFQIEVDGKPVALKCFEIYKIVLEYLEKYKADDVDAYLLLMKGFDSLLLPNIESARRMVPVSKNSVSVSLMNTLDPRKKYTRGGLIARAYDLHLRRVRSGACTTWTHSHVEVMKCLYKLCINHYAKVRVNAQNRFFRILDNFEGLIGRSVSDFFGDFLKSGVHHDEYKGTLYTLLGKPGHHKNSPLIANSWSNIKTLWLSLIKSPFSEKDSIIRITERIKNSVTMNFVYYPLIFEMTDEKVLQSAKSLLSKDELAKILKEKNAVEDNRNHYKELVDALVDISLNSSSVGGEGGSSDVHWRTCLLSTSMLSVLILDLDSIGICLSERTLQVFFDGIVSKSIDIRRTAMTSLAWIMVLFKRGVEKEVLKATDVVVTTSLHTALQYNPLDNSSIPHYKSKNNQLLPLYVHKPHEGYYNNKFPSKLTIKLATTDFSTPTPEKSSSKLISTTTTYFTSEPYLTQLLQTWSVADSSDTAKNKTKSTKRSTICKFVARNCGPSALKLLLKEGHSLGTCKTDQWKQKTAADILTGIICGMKHWSDGDIQEFWTGQFENVFSDCLNCVTQETIEAWSSAVAYTTLNRDPNKLRFFVEFLRNRFLKSVGTAQTTSVGAFREMTLLDQLITNLHWRGGSLYTETLELVKTHFFDAPIPYMSVRTQLGRVLSSFFEWDTHTTTTTTIKVCPKYDEFVDFIFSRLENLEVLAGKYQANEKDCEENAGIRKLLLKFKTAMEFLLSSTIDNESTMHPSLFRFIPLLCQFESYDPDPEVATLAAGSLTGLSKVLVQSNQDLASLLKFLKETSKSPSWRARLCVLEFLKVFALNNTSVLNSEDRWRDDVTDLVLSLLRDKKLEVRELSCKILCGFLHCLVVRGEDVLLKKFLSQASEFKQKRAQLKRKKMQLSPEDVDTGHSAILGLCAFVDTHPYHVPAFLPDVLVVLTTHLHDPAPVPATIRKCLSDFRRTHHDNWAVHKTKFTEDQLCILTDIFVSPCYYA